jgi:aminopeptidase N
MKKILFCLFLLVPVLSLAQQSPNPKSDAWKNIYRETPSRVNDLVNTRLDVSFDLSKSWMYGKELLTLKPHFYPTDSLTLDAKRMEIREISMMKNGIHVPLKFTYDSLKLYITLDRTYQGGENYTIFIDYISKPDEIKARGSAAITGAKGLYFVNPLGKDKNKPTEIWTQGETESNSGWVPTIDKPNQKTTDEISMTVPGKFVTLSNGLLVKQKKNPDGTRTDTWKMDLPHAPYLMMMATGEFAIIKDKYKNKEVSYYVEKEYAPVARKIFGLTPEMIAFYSKITGVDFPWQKYSQIAVRDYVSGAMENTTATVHGESAQQDLRQLVDGNSWEDVISHELFHMWFGDYVTTESWSNLCLNESFADFSEVLWQEYKHGRDAGDEHNFEGMQQYLWSNSSKKDLVRFYYRSREDIFDAVSYQKGGRILYMLRNYLGQDAFYKAMNLYLNTYKFGAAEAQELRLAFEDVTGKDLNWFWNQWFYGSGHPVLNISYDYNASNNSARVFVKQTQDGKIFRCPIAIDVYENNAKKRYNVWLENKADTFNFRVATKPDLINVDGDKALLCQKTDNKTIDNYLFQYKNAGLYLDRREAVEFAQKHQAEDPKALGLMMSAINDSYIGIRVLALQGLNLMNDSVKRVSEPVLSGLAKSDPSPRIRAAAIQMLGMYKKGEYRDLFLSGVDDSSYSVASGSLIALGRIDSVAALKKANEMASGKLKGMLSMAVDNILYTYAGDSDFDSLAARFDAQPLSNRKFNQMMSFANYLKKLNNDDHFKKGVDIIVKFRESIPEQVRDQVDFYFNNYVLGGIKSAKEKAGRNDLADYVKSKIPQNSPPPQEMQ